MSPDKQRVAIACLMWELVDCPHWARDLREKAKRSPINFIGVPDYLNDLNLMHAVEGKLMKVSQWQTYTQHLGKLTGTVRFCIVHATAAQRAEAFLRTLNLWEEEKL